MTGSSATQQINLNVSGKTTMRLVVTDAGNGNGYDHADWASARLITAAPVPPPIAPSGLNAVLNGAKVDLSWTDNSTDETGFRIERKLGPAGSWSTVTTVGAGVQSASDTSVLQPGSAYTYRVIAINAGGDSAASNESSINTPAGPAQVWLSDLNWTSMTNGWGVAEKDRSNGESGPADGKTISIRGNTYAKGIGVHAASDIRFSLAGQYTSFTTDVGVDNETAGKGSVVFQIYVDGVLKYTSGTVRGTDAVKSATISVAGANELRLVVTNAGDNNDFDHADWAGARLIK
jgi:hypothetical protein